MLEIKKIKKIYETESLKQIALNDISINFRKCEFACILGPSGSGKTTLLNIIGGLDKYNSGDLVINEISTKKYNDRDWDSYRNHRIGFVFQNYNLISHQSVLSNVELALTLSGVSAVEREARAKKVLKEVGLEEHAYKKPNQLSGGQMQRVAIARALVNDPDILLADEPTGALDSQTSTQIMELLKRVSKDKLVIMVTHNPELARKYSTRIIKLKDGKIEGDTNPYDDKLKEKNISSKEKSKKTYMSFKTALGLSFNNLMIKKKRTLLVSFASSIGIIGIALILSLSTGFQNYIDKIQEDTLSSYPLTITSETADMTSLLLSMVSEEGNYDKNSDIVTEKQYMSSIFSNIKSNDLKSFKNYLETNYEKIKNDVTSVKYTYSVVPMIYTIDASNNLSKLNPSSLSSSIYSSSVSSMTSSFSSIFTQMIEDKNMLSEQYDLLSGTWPENYNEMIIVLSEPNSISDMLIYSLGLRDTKELNDIVTKIMSGEEINIDNEPMEITYEELMNVSLKLIMQSDIYKYNSSYNLYEDMSEDENYMKKLYLNAENLKIVGVVSPKEGVTSMALSPGVAYTKDLINHIIDESFKSEIVKKQLENEEVNVISNIRFDEETNNSNLDFEDLISVDKDALESAFDVKINEDDIKKMTSGYMNKISASITTDINPAKVSFVNTLKTLSKNIMNDYIESPLHKNGETPVMYLNDVDTIIETFMEKNDSKKAILDLESEYVVPSSVFVSTYKGLIKGMLQGYISSYYMADPSLTTDINNPGAAIINDTIDNTVNLFINDALVISTSEVMAKNMTEALMQKSILVEVGELSGSLMKEMASAFNVDPDKISSAFKFDLSEEEIKRVMTAMMTTNNASNAKTNLINLGYQNIEEPTTISFYFGSFDSKEKFLSFIDSYNKLMENRNNEDAVINYTDTTGILMSSVKTVVDSVSYVLIAFVSISLIVSSIMIGIITYISVLERTKEIGILRAIGASKNNISSIFNAETFIIGLISGLMGITVSLILIIPINMIIHSLTGNANINAVLPLFGAIVLVILSIVLTLIGGLIPSKMASKKDPVEALRSE